MDETNSSHSLDLPLMSNISSRHVHHYILDLKCDFQRQMFCGCITLFSRDVEQNKFGDNIEMSKKSGPTYKYPFFDSNTEDAALDKICSNEVKSVKREENNSANFTNVNKVDSDCIEDIKSTNFEDIKNSNYERIKSSNYEEIKDNNCEDIKKSNCEDIKDSNSEKIKDSNFEDIKDSNCDAIKDRHTEEIKDSSCEDLKDSYFEDIMKSNCEDIKNSNHSDSFVLVLDSWDITVEKVEELRISTSASALSNDVPLKDFDQSELNTLLNDADKRCVNFKCDSQCIRIWKDGVSCSREFPDIVRIFYSTSPNGQSLKWTNDQDGNACVYTHGHWINNRSLFPSQDIPEAMASWRAYIHAHQQLTVLMTGDAPADISNGNQEYLIYYFYSKMEMPSSTLALAIGHWEEIVPDNNVEQKRFAERQTKRDIPYRVFAPKYLTRIAKDILCPYIPNSLLAASDLLGPYPFYRLDVLIVPSSFNSLGMASPSLMFLSQSVLSEDGGMLVRVSHEISHSWFGLLIGPKDWTEEWLSEGFCTYTEGIIHSNALQMSVEEAKERRELLDYLKYKTLQTELNITDVDLQTLRPNKNTSETDEDGISYVKNGMNPDKGFMQLHYLKGYFLLCFLESIVGLDSMCQYLKQLVQNFHHQLVNSQDVLSLFLHLYPKACKTKITLDYIYEEWLDNAGIPQFLTSYMENVSGNRMFQVVSENVLHIKHVNTTYSALHWRKRRKLDISSVIKLIKVNQVQTLLLLEMLVHEEKLHVDVLLELSNLLNLPTANSDIQHKWCELVVKFRVEVCYSDVRQFLIDHQAMGVYLFGELILSRDKEQRKAAEAAFNTIKQELEAGVYKTVCLMIYGTDDIG